MNVRKGFTLIELMIVVAIIACLSVISIPPLLTFLAKAKRAEAYMNLGSLCMAQKAYFADTGRYTTNLSGAGGLGWKPQGNFNYTYGFDQGDGTCNFIGQINTPTSYLSGSYVSENGFKIFAACDIDGDGIPDILSIDQNNKIKIEKNDLE